MILLSSSSFFLPKYLNDKIAKGNYTNAELNFALKHHYLSALNVSEKETEMGSKRWLYLNKHLAKTERSAALKLAYWFQTQLTTQQDVGLGDNTSKLNEHLVAQTVLWFEQAIRLHSQEAVVSLAQFYYEQGRLTDTLSTLATLSEKLSQNKVDVGNELVEPTELTDTTELALSYVALPEHLTFAKHKLLGENISEFNKSEFNKSEFNKSEFNKSEFNKSEVNKSEFNKSEVNKSEFNKSEFNKSEVNKSEKSLNEKAVILRIKLAIELGNLDAVNELINDHYVYLKNNAFESEPEKEQEKNAFSRLLSSLKKYKIVQHNKHGYNVFNQVLTSEPASATVNNSCISHLQLFATNLRHLNHVESLITSFEKQSLAKYICMPTPVYINKQQLNCIAKSQQPITCNEEDWKNVNIDSNIRHIGLMLADGGANVHSGILYFDEADNIDVFTHEVSHLVGFVDEYPLSEDHDACQSVQSESFSHNIAVLPKYYEGEQVRLRRNILSNIPWANQISDSTPILERIDNFSGTGTGTGNGKSGKWRLSTPEQYNGEVGIFDSKTCNNSRKNTYAFKALSGKTKLQYNASNFPQEYLTMLDNNPLNYLMPSYHYNIALALYQQGKVKEGATWLEESLNWQQRNL